MWGEAEEKGMENPSPWGGKGHRELGTEVLLFRGALSHSPAKVCCAVPKIKDHLDGIKSTLCRVCGGEGGDGRTLPEPVGWGVVWRDRMT